MPTVLLICEVTLGMGHLARTTRLAQAMAHRFRVVLLVLTDFQFTLDAPSGVELRTLSTREAKSSLRTWPVRSPVLEIAREIHPDAICIEYFPFGRFSSRLIYMPFLMQLHRLRTPRPMVFSSIRDIQDTMPNPDHAMHVALLLNRWFDGLLIHADERLSRLEQTFSCADAIRIPVTYTNYVGPPPASSAVPQQRGNTIVISCGGGLAAGRLLVCAIQAAKLDFLAGYKLRLFAGNLLPDREWNRLKELCAEVESVDLQRWTPDLRGELWTAAASVSQYGYNTALDLLATGVPALVVPYASAREPEQLNRARLMEERGTLRVLPREQLSPRVLASEIHETLRFTPRRLDVRMDGAERSCALLLQRLAQRQPAPAPEPVGVSRCG